MTEEFFRDLEQSLLRPDVRASATAVDRLLADDFVEFGSSGHAFGKKDVMEALQGEPAAAGAETPHRASRSR